LFDDIYGKMRLWQQRYSQPTLRTVI